MMKICRMCDIEKAFSFYTKRKDTGRYRNTCKECCSIKRKKHYEKNKSKAKQQMRQYYKDNKGHLDEKHKKYVKNNETEIKQYKAEWYQENKKRILENYKKELKNNPQKRISHYLRTRLNKVLKLKNISKTFQSHNKFLGCSPKEAKNYLEQQFREGMSWTNHGEWHIDHIIPLASFDLTCEEDVRKACHYTNLQPLWAEENLAKGDKIII